jgi:predicted MFS family arabinose efflux permease
MHEPSGPIPVRTLVFLACACFASGVSLRVADSILPDIATSFATTPGDAAKVITFFGLAYAVSQFIYGFVGDRYGLLRVITLTTVLSGVSSIVCALADSLGMLVLARIAVGLTAAAIIPLSFAWLGEMIPYARRQEVLAYFLSGQITGMILGQAVGGIIAEHFGWRWVFVVMAAFFVVAGIALAIEMRRRGDHMAAVVDYPEPALTRFVSMVRRPWTAIILITVTFEGMIFFGAYTFVGSFIWAKFDLSLDLVGLIVAGFSVGALIYSVTAARLLPRLGEGGLTMVGGALVAISFVVITTAPAPIFVVPATILIGFGYYMFHNTLQTNATQMAPDARGLAVATFASCLFLGQAVGVAFAAPIFDDTGGAPIFLAAGALLFLLGTLFRILRARF